MKKTRNKGWRKEVAKTKKARKRSDKKIKSDFIEKNWKFLYLRSEKLKRAKQLGIDKNTLRRKIKRYRISPVSS